MSRVGCFAVVLASCCGCCGLRLPTFGLGPDADLPKILAALQAEPFVVDGLCATEQTCEVVEGATLSAVPVGWAPLLDEWAYLVEVEATCLPSTELHERAAPFVCAGVVLAHVGVGVSVVGDTVFGLPEATGGGGGDWDWD